MSDTAQNAAAQAEQAADAAKEGFHFLVWDGSSIWLVVATAIILWVLYKKAWPLIAGGLDSRADRIRDELDEARRLKEDAQKALVDAKRKQRDAEAEAENIILHARESAEAMRKEADAALEHELKRREKAALDKIEQAKAKAVADIRNTAIDAAFAATRSLLEKGLDDKEQKRLIDDSIGEVSGKLH